MSLPRQNLLLGAACVLGAEFLFAAMAALVRHLSGELPNEVIVFFRNALALPFLLPWVLRIGGHGWRTPVLGLHLLRAAAGLSAMYCYFYAIAHMPLADAMLLKLSAPLFIPFVAFFWLGERISWLVRWALAVGFTGVALILTPSFEHLAPAALVALAGGALAAVAKTAVRRLTYSEPAGRIVFYFAFIATLISAVPLLWAWQTPADGYTWIALLASGLTGALGQLLFTKGFSFAPASRLGPFTYVSVLFGAAFGWLFWGELLTGFTVAGAVLVAAAGVMASRHRTLPPPPAPPLRSPPQAPRRV